MQLITCNICGRPCQHNAIISIEPSYILCPQCYQYVGTCSFCINRQNCLFETDSSPVPKQVQQIIRQGSAVIQTVVKNPERIRITCQEKCNCWNSDFGCLKQNDYCPNYQEINIKEIRNENN